VSDEVEECLSNAAGDEVQKLHKMEGEVQVNLNAAEDDYDTTMALSGSANLELHEVSAGQAIVGVGMPPHS
jgi:hypothetical protein